MQLNTFDWVIVALSLIVGFAPALWYMRRANKSSDEFFGSGRSAPWWLIGTSMVATTFSTDTPNLVTDFVRKDGVAKNWEWWSFLLTGMITVFFYARLWRRSGVLTDLEFYELRYSGKSASFVRGFRAVYLGLFFNCMIMASVTLAAAKIANVMLGWDPKLTATVCAVICIVFSSISGLWGVLTTDLIQFAIAMVGVTAAAWHALQHPAVGGLSGLLAKIPAAKLNVLPDFSNHELVVSVLVVPLAIQCWNVWYPGAEPGGGSYIAQRMLAAKNERHALAGTLWFNVAHYALRPWPWIIVALASMLVFPTLADIRHQLPHVNPLLVNDDLAYPAMLTLLPHGLLGLLVASLLAAYVSTMTTHLNWGCSYLVHDFYRRFIKPDATDRHVINLSRVLTVFLTTAAGLLMLTLDSAKQTFDIMLSVGAGTGLLYLMRWFWWRINAWSEVAAMAGALASAAAMLVAKRQGITFGPVESLLYPITATTIIWVGVTFLTKPTERATLIKFCEKVQPMGPGWAPVRAAGRIAPSPDSMTAPLIGCLSGLFAVYGALFAIGNFLYGRNTAGAWCTVAAVAGGLGLRHALGRMWKGPGAVE